MTSPAKKPPPPSNLVSPSILAGLGKLPVTHGNSPVGAPGLRSVPQKLMPPGFGTAQPSVAAFLKDLKEGGDVRQKIRAFLGTKAQKRREARERVSALKGLSLTYAPVNTEVYVTAYDGAFAGMTAGRLLLSSDQTTYLEQSLAAGVWAQQFDTLWNDAAALDEVQAEIILLGSSAVWQGRFANSLTSSETSPAILALIAAIEEVELFYSEQGIAIPLWNSGSGGGSSQALKIITGAGNVVTSAFGVYEADLSGGNVALAAGAGTNGQYLRVVVGVAGQGNLLTVTGTLLGTTTFGDLGSGAFWNYSTGSAAWV